ncbi:hypothetical protein BJV78DRAFT_1243431 [Lactifluus subvellereus]|nr:hypothetical protein BJV78DRAFT_1243431 [Lactifluus subvellereus]
MLVCVLPISLMELVSPKLARSLCDFLTPPIHGSFIFRFPLTTHSNEPSYQQTTDMHPRVVTRDHSLSMPPWNGSIQ